MHPILQLFSEQSTTYRVKEIGDGTHDFTKKVLEQVFNLAPKTSLVQESSLFGETLYDNFYKYEGSRKIGDKARWDFKCKINGKIVVIETERLGNIEAGMKQISGYMTAEHTDYGIVTDGGERRFFKNGADNLQEYRVLTIEQLCSLEGKAFLETFYNTYDFYLQRLSTVQSKPFDLQLFHQGLITTAERLVFDLRSIELFTGSSKEIEKQEIQTVYSLIIQLLLIKIVQDKRSINLLKKDVIVEQLKQQDRQGIFESVENQIKWLGDFYQPYHNQQDSLLGKIITHYQQGSRFAKLSLDSIRLFLDLYFFIYSFDFNKGGADGRGVKQDLFGSVYENYLKELYKDDETKKGQVFTPPEIVEFMLDEVGYTTQYIEGVITHNLNELNDHVDDFSFNVDGLSIIDPACGSGTFLYKASGRIVNALYNLNKQKKITESQAGKIAELIICNNIVGFDIEPFPLYLAEMNILQSLLFFNVGSDGKILNRIDQPIKIFSTNDSIAEFHNLEQSMENDLQDLIQGGELYNLSSKRDPKSILQLKADLQDFDRDVLMTKLQLAIYHQELQNSFYILDDQLIKTKQQTYRDKHSKKILAIGSIKELLAYVHSTLDTKYLGVFEKNIKSKKLQIEHIKSKLSEIITKQKAKRTKFDFVVGNPPYIAYNSIPQEIRDNRKQKQMNMNDIFGISLHSVPGSRKLYSPKPNLYSYFGALSYFLAKNNGKVCYITPEGFIGYDCNCYFLSEAVNLQRLYLFNTKVFVDRGIDGKVEICTSAMVFVYQKNNQNNDLVLKSYETENGGEGIKKIIDFMKDEKNKKIIKKDELRKYINIGFSVLKKNAAILNFLDKYKNNSQDISIYYDHSSNEKVVNENFYFDIGYLIDEKNLFEVVDETSFYRYFLGKGKYVSELSHQGWPKDKSKIGLMQANQGYSLLDSKYKIIRNKFMNKGYMFYFDDREVIRATSGRYGIGSDNKAEILYLFGILNSSTSYEILKSSDTGGEVEAFRVTNQKIKEQIRIPKIDTPERFTLKEQLIANSQAIINLCKSEGSSGLKTRGDICITTLDIDAGCEVITGLKSQYQGLGIQVDKTKLVSDPLPEDILALLPQENSDLAKLEQERDEIVRRLYGI